MEEESLSLLLSRISIEIQDTNTLDMNRISFKSFSYLPTFLIYRPFWSFSISLLSPSFFLLFLSPFSLLLFTFSKCGLRFSEVDIHNGFVVIQWRSIPSFSFSFEHILLQRMTPTESVKNIEYIYIYCHSITLTRATDARRCPIFVKMPKKGEYVYQFYSESETIYNYKFGIIWKLRDKTFQSQSSTYSVKKKRDRVLHVSWINSLFI